MIPWPAANQRMPRNSVPSSSARVSATLALENTINTAPMIRTIAAGVKFCADIPIGAGIQTGPHRMRDPPMIAVTPA